MPRKPPRKKPSIMVCSTVNGLDSLRTRIAAVLEAFDYDVIMSDRHTVRVDPRKSNLDNCLAAVEQADLILGIVTGRYGEPVDEFCRFEPLKGLSVTHREIRHAIAANKPRWFLVHYNVVVADSILRQFRKFDADRLTIDFGYKGVDRLDNIRILDLYDEIRLTGAWAREYPVGNWAQDFKSDDEAIKYVERNFEDQKEIIRRHLKPVEGV